MTETEKFTPKLFLRWAGEVFTIGAKPHDSKKKKLNWLIEVNEIRRVVAHPPRGGVSDAQFEYLTGIRDVLIPRLTKEE